LISSRNAGSNPIAIYTYNTKNIITPNVSNPPITFSPSKRADAITYTVCDSEKSSVAAQVIVTAVANISTVAGGTC
jgi:hypothetical protein